jgi:hypothetical protein
VTAPADTFVSSSSAATPLSPLSVSAIVVESEAPMHLAAFWADVFGVPVAPGATSHSASLMTSPRVPLLAFERPDGSEGRRGRISMRAYTDDLQAHVKRLIARGAVPSRPRPGTDDRRIVELRDPEGNTLVLVQL